MPFDEIPYTLLCAFYGFNIQYTSGCTNFYSFFEHIFLGVTPPKRSKLNHFITSVTNVSDFCLGTEVPRRSAGVVARAHNPQLKLTRPIKST